MPERVSLAEDPAGTATCVVLVVQEVSERLLTTRHLRESGFEVIEAADGDEARRALEERRIDVVFADFDMPGKTSGLGLLRVLHERHPATKTILTSGPDTDMSAVEGYGIFLSKPYRMVDLDHCVRRLLVAANGPARRAGAAMRGDRFATGAMRSTAQPGDVPASRRPTLDKADGRGDETSDEWSVELARQLAERAARQDTVAPGAAKAARRAALQAYDRAAARRLRLILGLALGATMAVAIVGLGPMVGWWPDPLSGVRTELGLSIATANDTPPSVPIDTTPSSSAPPSPSLAAATPDQPAVEPMANQAPSTTVAPSAPASPEPAPPSPPAPPESVAAGPPSSVPKVDPVVADQAPAAAQAANPAPLGREDVREIQARLRWFGFSPGPIDGATGARTTSAVMRYQQARGQSQTGTVDHELLTQLREDPAPQPAQPAVRPEPRFTHSAVPQRSDPLEPVRAAAQRFDRWMQSVLR
jgi:DNA-binding response OmpR family regulator